MSSPDNSKGKASEKRTSVSSTLSSSAKDTSVNPASFYSTSNASRSSLVPPPLPSRPLPTLSPSTSASQNQNLGSSNTTVTWPNEGSSPFREPELVQDDTNTPTWGQASALPSAYNPLYLAGQASSSSAAWGLDDSVNASTEHHDYAPGTSWGAPSQNAEWGAAVNTNNNRTPSPIPGLLFPSDSSTTYYNNNDNYNLTLSNAAAHWSLDSTNYSASGWNSALRNIEIDGRDLEQETNWWDPEKLKDPPRPGRGILPPLMVECLHDAEHTLFSVGVTPPDIAKLPQPASPAHAHARAGSVASNASAGASSLSLGTPKPIPVTSGPPVPPPSAEEVRTAIPHPNAYYCRKHNSWVLLIWKSSSQLPPLAKSFLAAHPDGFTLPDQARRRRTGNCLQTEGLGGKKANRTHHFHVYEKAVEGRNLTPPFRRGDWEREVKLGEEDEEAEAEVKKEKSESDMDVVQSQGSDGAVPMEGVTAEEEEEDEETDLLDLYVCCQCSLYCVASSEVLPGVVEAKHIDQLVKTKMENPIVGKNGPTTALIALELILKVIEKKVWERENRPVPVNKQAFQKKIGYDETVHTIFESLGFYFKDDGAGTDASFGLYPPTIDLVTPQGRKSRAKLLRGWIELSAWAVEYQTRFTPQLKDHGAARPWVTVTSQREHYQEALGAHPDQIPRGEIPLTLRYNSELIHAWEVLGMTQSTYSPQLLVFAYLAQCRCDPAMMIDYFTAYIKIFQALSANGEILPDELQNLIIEERSRHRFTTEDYASSIALLGFGQHGALGVELDDEVEEEFVINAWKDAKKRVWQTAGAVGAGGGGKAKYEEVMEAFLRVAQVKGSREMMKLWEEESLGTKMTPDRAFTTLDVPQDVDESMLIAIFSMRIEDQPSSGDTMREALAVIAETRDSDRLRQFLTTGIDPGEVVVPTRSDWPRGLNQLGNTCYLNSLLQYFYTIKELRDAIAPLINAQLKSIDEDKLTDDDLKRHRVGGRNVTRREILRSKKFVSQLAELFEQLESCDNPAVTPTVELAKLALITSKDEEEDDFERGGTDTSNDTDATLVDDGPSGSHHMLTAEPAQFTSQPNPADVPLPVSAASPGSIYTGPGSPGEGSSSSSSVLGKRTRGSVSHPERRTTFADMDVDLDKENYVIVPPLGAAKYEHSPTDAMLESPVGQEPVRRRTLEAAEVVGGGKDVQDEVMEVEVVEGPREASGQQVAPKPPPLPPRKPASDSVMMFGRQHDVSECMDNCIFQIEAALLKFDGTDTSEPDKTSVVKRLFFGTVKQRVSVVPQETQSRSSVHEREDLYSLLPVNVTREGYDLYDGLAGYFDDEVEFESKKAHMEVTLVDVPPILQIQLQRGQFDRETLQPYKSQVYLKFGETIYMDRFLDSANPEKKERAKVIQAELNACRERLHLLTAGKHAPFAPSLGNALDFLKKQDPVELPEFDEDLVSLFNAEQPYLAAEIDSLRTYATKLKGDLEDVWANDQRAAYELTSVFIHRGSSPSWGHYFFYSRNLPDNPDQWFKYNDSDVSKVSKDEVLADTTGSTANPYLLVFVKKGTQHIDTVHRRDLETNSK